MGVTPLDYLATKYRISKTWLASQIGLSPYAFDYAMKRGLRDSEMATLEKALQKAAKRLKKGPPKEADFDQFCASLGLSKKWLAKEIEKPHHSCLTYALKRGLREEEKERLRLTFLSVASVFENLQLPRTHNAKI